MHKLLSFEFTAPESNVPGELHLFVKCDKDSERKGSTFPVTGTWHLLCADDRCFHCTSCMHTVAFRVEVSLTDVMP